MLDKLLSLFRRGGASGHARLSAEFEEAGAIYLQLVKTKVVCAMVDKDRLLVPSRSVDDRTRLLPPLCAYFVARTDMELERLKLPEHARNFFIDNLPEMVTDEIGFSGDVRREILGMIYGNAGMIRAVMEAQGADNAAAMAKTFMVLARVSQGAVAGDLDPGQVSELQHGLERLLGEYPRLMPDLKKAVAAWESSTAS